VLIACQSAHNTIQKNNTKDNKHHILFRFRRAITPADIEPHKELIIQVKRVEKHISSENIMRDQGQKERCMCGSLRTFSIEWYKIARSSLSVFTIFSRRLNFVSRVYNHGYRCIQSSRS
jgi:hypothetical protein